MLGLNYDKLASRGAYRRQHALFSNRVIAPWLKPFSDSARSIRRGGFIFGPLGAVGQHEN